MDLLRPPDKIDESYAAAYQQLWTAMKNGDHDHICETMLEEELDLELRDKSYRTPLLAIFHEPVLIQNQRLLGVFAVSLVSSRADIHAIDPHGRSSLRYAAMLGNLDMTKFLLREGAEDILPDRAGRLAVHQALYGRHIDVARAIAEAGVNVYQPDKRGKTAESPRASWAFGWI